MNLIWDRELTIEIPDTPGEVIVEIPDSVFALYKPRKNGNQLTLCYGPVDVNSKISKRKILFRNGEQKVPKNYQRQFDAQPEGRCPYATKIFLEVSTSPLIFEF